MRKHVLHNYTKACKAAHAALADCIAGVRNAPHTTLTEEMKRARAYHTLLWVATTPGSMYTEQLRDQAHKELDGLGDEE